jgi:hypothetical protein
MEGKRQQEKRSRKPSLSASRQQPSRLDSARLMMRNQPSRIEQAASQ